MRWQTDQSEFFQENVLEIVTEYAGWRDLQEAAAADLLEALKAWDEYERADDEYRDLCERSWAEGWDEETGGSHLSSAWTVVEVARDRARSLRDAALSKARAAAEAGSVGTSAERE